MNSTVKQHGDLSELIWNVPDTIAYLSSLFALEPGDLIYSGTPAGVGPIVKGDIMLASVEGVTQIEVLVA